MLRWDAPRSILFRWSQSSVRSGTPGRSLYLLSSSIGHERTGALSQPLALLRGLTTPQGVKICVRGEPKAIQAEGLASMPTSPQGMPPPAFGASEARPGIWRLLVAA
jgi:hypothetical protein